MSRKPYGESAVRPENVARGYVHGETGRKAVIILDDETFEQIRAIALEQGKGFASAARFVIETGLETLELETGRSPAALRLAGATLVAPDEVL